MSRRGRPPVLDSKKREAICDLVARGYTGRAAAEEVGCPPATLFMALRRDPAFAARLDAAKRQAQTQGLPPKRQDDWRAATRALVRLNPARYGPPGISRRPSWLDGDDLDDEEDGWDWLYDPPPHAVPPFEAGADPLAAARASQPAPLAAIPEPPPISPENHL